MLGGLCALALAVGQHARLIPRIVRGNKWFTPSVYVIIGAVLLVRTGALAHLASLT
jgi:cadmium resistance protein CadD (predicted permease)